MRIALAGAVIVLGAGAMAALAQTVTPLPKEPAVPQPRRSEPRQAATETPESGLAAARASDKEYADCLGLWDAKTHMTRQEWSATCKRVQTRINSTK